MTEQALRDTMVMLGASLFQRGYATGGAGNLSALLPDGTLIATPTGSCLGRLSADRLSHVNLQGEHLGGDRPAERGAEIRCDGAGGCRGNFGVAECLCRGFRRRERTDGRKAGAGDRGGRRT